MATTLKIRKFNVPKNTIEVDSSKGITTIASYGLANALIHHGEEIANELGVKLNNFTIDATGKVAIKSPLLVSKISKQKIDLVAWNICCSGCGC